MKGIARHIAHFARHPGRVVRNVRYWQDATVSPRRHLFIVGVPRSGTTLLKSILVAHPDIGGCDNESTGIFGFRDIFAYEMGELSPEAVKTLLAGSSGRVAFYDRVIDRLLAQQEKSVFVDKLQLQAYRLRYAAVHFPSSVFLHLVRDGRDGYCSALEHPNVRQSRSVAAWARYWSRAVTIPGRVLPVARVVQVRYEDLTADPEGTVRALMERLGLPFDPRQIDVSHYASTTTMRRRAVHANLQRPIHAGSHRRWANELSVADIATFDRIAGPALEAFGYERGAA